jgi:hypothetical protein
MTHLERATEDLVKVTRKLVSGGELALKVAPKRGERFYYQGKRIDHATAIRLGW